MTLPRWLLCSMVSFSVAAALAAAGWWWVTWPERTAREFVGLVAERRLNEAHEYLAENQSSVFQRYDELAWENYHCENYFEFPTRNLSDLAFGRRMLRAGLWNEWTLTVQRGRITATLDETRKEGLSKPYWREVTDDPESER